MAGKKPAKAMAGQGHKAQDPAIYGSPMKYIGTSTSPFICPKCNKKTIRGMLRVKPTGETVCSITCAQAS